ncbi:MAG: aldo/keto reductase [Candidatus Lokiarchaeota archaeon]|nr:aldo/keto reductase [Candidatus Lokiarchaeota archaeon]
MNLPLESKTFLNSNLKISRIINGMWQVSGAHGYINKNEAIKSMNLHVENGFTTWDLADHYGPAEDFVKVFREQRIREQKEESLEDLKFFTKWVPRPQKITRELVNKAIDISRNRMGIETLDMLQFHWWEYQDKNYLKAITFLDDLRKDGTLSTLGLTNFDTEHTEEFLKMGVKIVSNQVQYSLIDRRPEQLMVPLCKKYNVKLLAYGTLCGGLLTEKYLNQPEPLGEQLYTASLSKYKNMIDRWGDWKLFQELLQTLKRIASKYSVTIANVAVRYVLENPVVGGAIIGVRLGISEHIEQNSKTFSFSLNQDDFEEINRVLSKSKDLLQIIGDCGDEYRR